MWRHAHPFVQQALGSDLTTNHDMQYVIHSLEAALPRPWRIPRDCHGIVGSQSINGVPGHLFVGEVRVAYVLLGPYLLP
jgi:hypothetical protein